MSDAALGALRTEDQAAYLLRYRSHIMLHWNGWCASIGDLLNQGWSPSIVQPLADWKNPRDSAASHRYLYFRHPEHNSIARARLPKYPGEQWPPVLTMDYLTAEHNGKLPKRRVLDDASQEGAAYVQQVTAADIPALFDLILALQAPEQDRIRGQRKPGVVVPLAVRQALLGPISAA